MNYALLRKYQYIGESNQLDKVFAQSANALRANKSPGCYEIVIYLSDSEPNIFFAMSLWFSLEELESIFKRSPTLEQVGGVVLIEQKIFELVQEYRQLDTKIEASLMRLTKYSEPLDPGQTLKSTTEGKKKARQLSGYIGGWAGLCLSDPRLLLTRADWSSQTTFRAFLEDASPDSLVKWYFSQGIHNENASYDLRAVIALVP